MGLGVVSLGRFLRVVGQYIDEGKVSVSSLSISGAVVGPEMKKIYHINQCILYAKVGEVSQGELTARPGG